METQNTQSEEVTDSQQAPAAEPNETDVPQEQSGDQEAEIDYKSELARAQEQLKKAEYSAEKAKTRLKEERRLREETGGETSEAQPDVVDAAIKAAVEERMELVRMDMTSTYLEDALDKHASSSDERELIRFHFQNSIKQTGYSRHDIDKCVETAKLLANASKFRKLSSEMAETMKTKQSLRSGSSAGASQDKSQPNSDLAKAFSPMELDLMRRNKVSEAKIRELAQTRKLNNR